MLKRLSWIAACLCLGASTQLPLSAASREAGAVSTAPDPRDLPAAWDDLAPWRSPLARPLLTEGEYLILQPERLLRADLDGDGLTEQVVVAPFDTATGGQAYSIGVLTETPGGYASRVLLNCYAGELRDVSLARLAPATLPRILVRLGSGSGGFLWLDVWGWSGRRYASLWSVEGVYQGRSRLWKASSGRRYLRLTRSIAGGCNAWPRGESSALYRWERDRFALLSRWRGFMNAPVRQHPAAAPLPRGDSPVPGGAVSPARKPPARSRLVAGP
ncbi:MAG TPA: hypothetical protein VK689_08380 [Armatimonadota bacterium]|nr:hypothetical protein [Armatimonadota bacterium]